MKTLWASLVVGAAGAGACGGTSPADHVPAVERVSHSREFTGTPVACPNGATVLTADSKSDSILDRVSDGSIDFKFEIGAGGAGGSRRKGPWCKWSCPPKSTFILGMDGGTSCATSEPPREMAAAARSNKTGEGDVGGDPPGAGPKPRTVARNRAEIARNAWNNGFILQENGNALVTEDNKSRKDFEIAFGATVIATLLSLGIYELAKSDCPGVIKPIAWDKIAKSERQGEDLITMGGTVLPLGGFLDPPVSLPGFDVPADMIAINFKLGDTVTWKKMLLGANGNEVTRLVASAEGANGQSGFVLLPASSALKLVFMKPKKLGNWCKMYQLDGIGNLSGGHAYQLIWLRDTPA